MESKKLGRSFLLGAGFSKATADGPLMCEIYSNMEKVYQREKKRGDVPAGNNRVEWFEDLAGFIRALGILENTFRNNLEYLVTLLDLRIDQGNGKFIIENIDINDPNSYPLDGWTRDRLEHIRDVFATYLFLCLEPLTPNGIGIKFAESNNEEDLILTFNYDLALEKALWKVNRWTPNEGYIRVSDFEVLEDKAKLAKSPVRLLKLHGSLNWLPPQVLPKENLRITLDNLECWGFFFENMQTILKRDPKGPSGANTRKISKGYAGGIHPYWFLPSYLKPFDSKKELEDIWKKARKIFEGTNNLVIIGYSFPKEDENSKSLFQ
jgi:hypothetical protein